VRDSFDTVLPYYFLQNQPFNRRFVTIAVNGKTVHPALDI